MRSRKHRAVNMSLLSIGIVILLALSSVGNAWAGGLSDAKKEKEELEKELDEAQALIDGLKDSKTDMETAVKELDKKLTQISERIAGLEEQLSQKQTQVATTQEGLAEAETDRQKQYDDMKKRIQFMYENQSTSAVEKLLSSGSIAEFLNNAEYIAQISQYDRNMLVKYEETVDSIVQMEDQLRIEIADLETMKQQVQKEQNTVAALLTAKEETLSQTEGEITDAQQIAMVYEAEIDAQNEIIAQIQQAEEEKRQRAEQERARKEQEEAQKAADNAAGENSGGNSGSTGEESGGNTGAPEEGDSEPEFNGSFTWPCPSSTRITSDYGARESPTAGASSFHKGIDIGAAHGADIVAAADGKVIFAGYSSSAGNYTTVDHGSGVYTVYMHCSSLNVSKGNSVSRGQVIAKVGSTGVSTGNHLHFGVSENGTYVNPWNYLR